MGDNKGMDRRGFLKTAAFSSLALGGAAALAGCAPAAGTDGGAALSSTGDIAWDKEVDVLVLGSGTGAFDPQEAPAQASCSLC